MNALNVSRTEQRVIPFWYRGSLNVNPLAGNGRLTDDPRQGNGRQTQLEQDIREFEAWQHAEAAQ